MLRRGPSIRLAKKLIGFSNSLGPAELYNFHLMLSAALGGLAQGTRPPAERTARHAWSASLRVLGHVGRSGLVRIGRPGFLAEEFLPGLIAEARQLRAVARRTGPHEIHEGGPVAEALAGDRRMMELVRRSVGEALLPTGEVNYHYSNREGDYLPPHVDPGRTSYFNCMIGIEHKRPPGRRTSGSALIAYGSDGSRKRLRLRSGEAAILMASGTVHAREPLKAGEELAVLTIGFRPKRRRF